MEENAEDKLDATLRPCEEGNLDHEDPNEECCEDLEELHRSILSLCDNCVTIDETKCSPLSDVIVTDIKESTSDKNYSDDGVGKMHMQDPGLSPIKLPIAEVVPKKSGGVSKFVSESNVLCLDDVDQTYEELITEITALCESHNSESEGTDNFEEEDEDQLLEENKYLSTIGLGSILSSTPNPDLTKREGEYIFTFDVDGRTDNCSIIKPSGTDTPLKPQTPNKSNTSTAIHDTPNIAVMKASARGQPGRFKDVNVSRQTDVDSTLLEDLDDAGIDILGLDEFTTMVESEGEDEEYEEKENLQHWRTMLHKSPEGDDTLKDVDDGVAETLGKHGKKRSSSAFLLDLREHSMEVKTFLSSETLKDDNTMLGQNFEMKRRKTDRSPEHTEVRPIEDQTVDVRKIVRDQIAEMVREVTEQSVSPPNSASNEGDIHRSDPVDLNASTAAKQSKIVRDQIDEMVREVSESGQTVLQPNSIKMDNLQSDPPLTDANNDVEKLSKIVRDQIAEMVREVNETDKTLPQPATAINKVDIPTHNTFFSNNSVNVQTSEKRPKIIFGQITKDVERENLNEKTILLQPKGTPENVNISNSDPLYSVQSLYTQNVEKQSSCVRGQIAKMVREVNEDQELPLKIVNDVLVQTRETELQNDSWIIIDLADPSDNEEPVSQKLKEETVVPITADLGNGDITAGNTGENHAMNQTESVCNQIAEMVKQDKCTEQPLPDLNVPADTDISESDTISVSEKVASAKVFGNDNDNENIDLGESEMILLSELPEEAELDSSQNDSSDPSESEMISIQETPGTGMRIQQKNVEVIEPKKGSGSIDILSKCEASLESKTILRKFEEVQAPFSVEAMKIGSEAPVPAKTEVIESKPVDLKLQETPDVTVINATGPQKNMCANIPKVMKGLQSICFDSDLVKAFGEKKPIQKKNEGKIVGRALPQTKSSSGVTNLSVKKPEAKVHPMAPVSKKATVKQGSSVNRALEAEHGHLGIRPQPVSGVGTAETTVNVMPDSIFLEEDNEIIKQVKERWECDGIPTPDINLTCANYWRKHQLKESQRVTPTRTSYLEGNFRASPMVDRINKSKEKAALENNRGTKRKRERDDVVVDSSDDYRWDGKRARYDHEAGTAPTEDASSSLKKQLDKLRKDFRQRVQNLCAEQDQLKRDMAHHHIEQTENLRRRQTREMQTLYYNFNSFDTRLLQRPFIMLRNQHQSQMQQLRCEQLKSIESMEMQTKRKIADERKSFVSIDEQLRQLLEKDEGKVGDSAKMVYKMVSLTKGPCKTNGQKKSWVKVCLPADIASAIIREDLIYDAFYDY